MDLTFTKATKEQARLRLALFGPSGSGKTFTALRLAAGLGGRIALVDTERGSASKYADRFAFDTLNLPKADIDTYCAAIAAASKAGYDILIVDSLTHGWHELLAEVDRLARSKFSGNTWSAWSEGTPKQRRLVDAILAFDGHIIATMRTKTEWQITTDDRGKTKPIRLGLAPEQGKGIEYEFDLLMELSPDHIATITKDRTGKYQDATIDKPGEDLGRELAAWLSEGVAPSPRPQPAPPVLASQPAAQPPRPTPIPAKAETNGKPTPNGNGSPLGAEPPARRPTDLLAIVNGRLQVPYENIHHLLGGIRHELGPDWNWPTFKDSAGWLAGYAAAMKHGQAKEIPAPVAADKPPLTADELAEWFEAQ